MGAQEKANQLVHRISKEEIEHIGKVILEIAMSYG
jgi:hypothetical protein